MDMKRTLDEKLEYNRKRADLGSSFSKNYVLGVLLYGEYPKTDAEGKATIKRIIDTEKEFARDGNEGSKGFMCGIRDAANERKARKGK